MKLTARALAARACLAIAAIAGCAGASATTYTFRLSAFGLAATAPAEAAGPYTFSSCGATGAAGPAAAQCAAAYSATPLNGFTTTSGGIQSWAVPTTGTYTVVLAGAPGGGAGFAGEAPSKGAVLTTTLSLTKGTVLQILVGQAGLPGWIGGGGGGGGTFVVASGSLLAAAGGGGGAPGGSSGLGYPASTNTVATGVPKVGRRPLAAVRDFQRTV